MSGTETLEKFNALTFEQRKAQSDKLRKKYPKATFAITNYPVKEFKMKKFKFILPEHSKISDLMTNIRKQIVNEPGKKSFNKDKAIFIFANNTIPPMSALISEVAKEYSSSDGFLHLDIQIENTFG